MKINVFICISLLLLFLGGHQAFSEEFDISAVIRLNVQDAEASSVQGSDNIKGETYLACNVIDNSLSTRWSSEFKEPQWIQLDLGDIVHVEIIEILWETAYAVAYTIQISNDNEAWHTVFRTNSGDGKKDEIIDVGKEARYIRVTCVKRKSKHWGFSIWEIKVFGKKKWTFI